MMRDDGSNGLPPFIPDPPRILHPDVRLEMTVNDALRRIPNAGLVFNAFGVDACCGGANTLDAAARDAGIDAAVLLDALASVVDAEKVGGAR